MQRSLRVVLVAAILASGVLLVSSATLQSFGAVRLRVLLSLLGLGVGSFVALFLAARRDEIPTVGARRRARAHRFPKFAYHLVVWSVWTTQSELWRVVVDIVHCRRRVGDGAS